VDVTLIVCRAQHVFEYLYLLISYSYETSDGDDRIIVPHLDIGLYSTYNIPAVEWSPKQSYKRRNT
jgi:hypothetical protein